MSPTAPTIIPVLTGPVPLSLPLAQVQQLFKFFLLPIEETSDAEWDAAQDLIDTILADRAVALRTYIEAGTR
jgi:hypothetical protein